jgi:hypothetical protein
MWIRPLACLSHASTKVMCRENDYGTLANDAANSGICELQLDKALGMGICFRAAPSAAISMTRSESFG